MDNKFPSNKKFGFLFTLIFIILSGYFYLYKYSNFLIIISLIIATTFLITALIKPIILKPFNVLWFKLSIFLSKIVNPIILGIIFYILITPIAIITKIFGRDILKIKYTNKITYWINKDKIDYDKESFKKQY